MRKLKFQLDRHTLEIIYLSFIRPIIEYADVFYTNCTQAEKDDLTKIQHEAARIVCGATKLVSINNLQREVPWETLEQRRATHRLLLLYKMKNDLSPSYLSSLVPQTVGEQSHYNLRNATDIQGIHARTSLYYNSFLPSTLRDWNALTPDQQNAPSLASFKRLIRKTNRCPSYYYAGTRKWQIHHTRLRTECALNQHLFRKNIVASPLCQCGLQETNTQVLSGLPTLQSHTTRFVPFYIPLWKYIN